MLSNIEFLELEKEYARLSYIILLDYSYNHNRNILANIKKPTFYDDEIYLHLGNNALFQLDIFNNNNMGLFDIINKTSTPMGKRYLKSMLTSPYTSVNKIQESYDNIEEILINDI